MKRVNMGFSLVELSIVLVILGLLAGGILSGQSLIRAAELRSVTTDMQRFVTSSYTFRDKYLALPGDMSNAEKFWSTWSPNANPASVTGAKNGNGNGLINSSGAVAFDEMYNSFRHLSLAGLVEGRYAGSYKDADSVATSSEPGITVPNARLGGKGIINVNAVGGTQKIYGTQGNYFMVQQPTVPHTVVKPEEAWGIDTKIDDGKPDAGKVMGLNEASNAADRKCSDKPDFNNEPGGSGTYRLEENSIQCWMLFWL
jgi:prepilin-type N-terminal cleavage/methylation domain-containing protein